MEKYMLEEKIVHGSLAYPFAVYKMESELPEYVQLHWHKETEIIYLKEGSFDFTINTKVFHEEAPALIFVSSQELHSIIMEKKHSLASIVFDLNMLSFENYDGIQYKIIQPLLKGKTSFPRIIKNDVENWGEISGLFEMMMDEARKRDLCSYLRVKARLYEILAFLYQDGYLKEVGEVNEKDTFRIDGLKRVLSYIQEHFNEKMSLEEIASVAGMNEQYLCRYFKKHVGKTITEYINDVRINHATQKLLQTDDKIIDIAIQCGYENVGYFLKRFRKEKGLTPSAFRETQKSI